MNFVEPRLFVDPDAAARKIVEIANGLEAVQDTVNPADIIDIADKKTVSPMLAATVAP